MPFLILRKTLTTKIETNIPARTTPNAKTGFFNVSKIFHHIKIQFLADFRNFIIISFKNQMKFQGVFVRNFLQFAQEKTRRRQRLWRASLRP